MGQNGPFQCVFPAPPPCQAPPPPHPPHTHTHTLSVHILESARLAHLRLVATVGQQLAAAAHHQVQLQLRLWLLLLPLARLGVRAVLAQRQIHCSIQSSKSSSRRSTDDQQHTSVLSPAPALCPSTHAPICPLTRGRGRRRGHIARARPPPRRRRQALGVQRPHRAAAVQHVGEAQRGKLEAAGAAAAPQLEAGDGGQRHHRAVPACSSAGSSSASSSSSTTPRRSGRHARGECMS